MATGGEASHPSITSASQSLLFAVANDATSNDANDANTTFLPPLVSQPPLPPNLTQHGKYADVAYVKYLSRSSMELHHRRTRRGMQHDAAVERAKLAERNRKLEEEQIVRAARGVYALSSTQSDGKGDGGEVGEGGNGGDGGDGEGNEDGMPAATVGTRVVSNSGEGRKRKDIEGGNNDEDYEEEDNGRESARRRRRRQRGQRPDPLEAQGGEGKENASMMPFRLNCLEVGSAHTLNSCVRIDDFDAATILLTDRGGTRGGFARGEYMTESPDVDGSRL
jgi:hypothetical protein